MTTVDAVLIDIDGTLMDSNPLHVLAWLRAFRRLGLEVPGGRVLDLMGMGGDQLAPTVLGEDHPEIERAKDLWTEEYSRKGLVEHAEPLPGAAAFLRALRERGVRTALASSGEPHDVERYVELLGGRGGFDELVSSGDVEATKPEPDIFAAALDRLGRPRSALVVGDTVFDVEAAGRLNVPCVAVLSGGIPRARLEEAGAIAIYDGVEAITGDLDRVLALGREVDDAVVAAVAG